MRQEHGGHVGEFEIFTSGSKSHRYVLITREHGKMYLYLGHSKGNEKFTWNEYNT